MTTSMYECTHTSGGGIGDEKGLLLQYLEAADGKM